MLHHEDDLLPVNLTNPSSQDIFKYTSVPKRHFASHSHNNYDEDFYSMSKLDKIMEDYASDSNRPSITRKVARHKGSFFILFLNKA